MVGCKTEVSLRHDLSLTFQFLGHWVHLLKQEIKRELSFQIAKRCTFRSGLEDLFWITIKVLCMWAKLLQSCPTVYDPMDCNLPGSSVHGILQARILEPIAIPFSRNLPNPGIEPASLRSPALAGGFFTTSAIWEATLKYSGSIKAHGGCLDHLPSQCPFYFSHSQIFNT